MSSIKTKLKNIMFVTLSRNVTLKTKVFPRAGSVEDFSFERDKRDSVTPKQSYSNLILHSILILNPLNPPRFFSNLKSRTYLKLVIR